MSNDAEGLRPIEDVAFGRLQPAYDPAEPFRALARLWRRLSGKAEASESSTRVEYGEWGATTERPRDAASPADNTLGSLYEGNWQAEQRRQTALDMALRLGSSDPKTVAATAQVFADFLEGKASEPSA